MVRVAIRKLWYILMLVSTASSMRIKFLTGGCWHNYTYQLQAMNRVFRHHRIHVRWDVVSLPCSNAKRTVPQLWRYGWSKHFDLVIFNGCWGNLDPKYVNAIVQEFRTVATPLFAMHCAMHSFRDNPNSRVWHRLLGVSSIEHEAQTSYRVNVLARRSKIFRHLFYGHVVRNDELYVITKLMRNTRVMALANSKVDGRSQPVFWTHWYRGYVRVFGTTFGHSDESFRDWRLMTVFVRGAMWAAGRLHDTTWFTERRY